jgi:beta-mannosidase
VLDLSGRWRAHVHDPEIAKAFAAPAFDDGAWPVVDIPHHWRSEPEFEEVDGPVLYRHRFSCEPLGDDRRRFLELDGIFYYGDVWFDGDYLGATEGYFFRHSFEITAASNNSAEHVLAVEVACPPQVDRTAKRTITGVYGQSSMLDPEYNPGGIWRPVRIAECGPVRIATMRVLCTEASVARGRLACHLELDSGDELRYAQLHAVVRGPVGETLVDARRDVTLAIGENQLQWTLLVDEPPRWWPRSLGRQELCALELTVEVDGITSDTRQVVTAFREVRADDWKFSVNGERMFLKGADLAPQRLALAEVDAALARADVQRALDANLDFLRVHAHVAPAALYEAADAAGLLLWQDLPMEYGYARGVRRQAVRQARAMVDVLAHHPSVFLWCAHDGPFAVDVDPGEFPKGGKLVKLAATAVLPTWGKVVLDRSIARAIARRDSTRPVSRHSGVYPGAGDAGADTHGWFGWYYGSMAGLAMAIRAVPRAGRFVSKFGAQSVPNSNEWMHPDRWPDLDWDDISYRHGMQREVFARRVPVDDAKSFDEWQEATQAYQAALLQLQIEDLRRCKYAPTGGFAVFAFADSQPAVSWSVLDHDRSPKRGFAALRDACRPVLPMVDPRTGNVHIVNDTRKEYTSATVEVVVDGHARHWEGDVPADAIVFVGRVDLGDTVDVEATLVHDDAGRIANRYPLLVLEAGRAHHRP